MRIIEPQHLGSLNRPKRTRKIIWRTGLVFIASLIIVVAVIGTWLYKLPLPKVSAKSVTVQSSGTIVNLPWPRYGQSAIGAVGYGLLAASPNQKSLPTASVIKIMTAIAVLRAKPLEVGQDGPMLTLTLADVQIYSHYVAVGGSVVPVNAGEQISELQALEAMLLPSANNMADSLATWAFGSMQNYSTYANALAKQLGLDSLIVTSASGFPPSTVGSSADLVKLGILAMENPVLSGIVSLKSTTVPVAGKINNLNYLLGHNGIVGIKTGDTDQAGGCYLFAAKHTYASGQTVTLVGAIMDAPVLATALNDSSKLIDASFNNFSSRQLVKTGDKLGYYDLPWGGQVAAVAENNVVLWGWKGSNLAATVNLNDIEVNSKSGAIVGSVQNGNESSQLLLSSNVSIPNSSWRLKRWF